MEVTLEEFILLLKAMVSLKKIVKIIQQKIQIISHALPFKNVKIALIQKDKNQEIKVIAGLLQDTQSGK